MKMEGVIIENDDKYCMRLKVIHLFFAKQAISLEYEVFKS